MESQDSQSTPSPQSPQSQDPHYHQINSNTHNDLNDSFQFECMINPTPPILSLNGLLLNAQTQKTQTETMVKFESIHDNDHANDNNNNCLPPQFSGFPSPSYAPPHYQSISVQRYPPPHFPPPPNTTNCNDNKQCLMQYQPIMFPAMIPLIPLNTNIRHPPIAPNNVINEDDIFGAKYSPLNCTANNIMIINQINTERTRNKDKKRKRKRDNTEYDSSNDSDDDDYDDDDDDNNDNAGFEGISNLITGPISKKRKINDDINDEINENGRHFCRYCNKSFVQNCHLSRHIREKHASLKPAFDCQICSKSFNQRSNLKVHLRSHALDESVSRPWLCTECYPNRRFTRKSSLKRHWVKKHKSISAQLISQLDLSLNRNLIKTEHIIKNESTTVQSLRFDNGIYRIGDIEIPPEVFESTNLPNLPPLLGN